MSLYFLSCANLSQIRNLLLREQTPVGTLLFLQPLEIFNILIFIDPVIEVSQLELLRLLRIIIHIRPKLQLLTILNNRPILSLQIELHLIRLMNSDLMSTDIISRFIRGLDVGRPEHNAHVDT